MITEGGVENVKKFRRLSGSMRLFCADSSLSCK